MRKPTYLSPSALALFRKDKNEYYVHYLAEAKPPHDIQTPAMAVGSAFDAYVKSYLHERIYGTGHPEAPKYNRKSLFEAQVQPHCRDVCWKIGAYLFEQYKISGALGDLMIELQNAVDDPRFEFEIKGQVMGVKEGVTTHKIAVPLLGKPDIRFINSEGAHAIFDWKVNGYYASGNTSPMAGYIECRIQKSIQHWVRMGAHKDCFPTLYKGMWINTGNYLENLDEDWAAQLATYSWLLGEEVGVENILGIDQLVCHGGNRFDCPDGMSHPCLRIASHRLRVSSNYQFRLMSEYQILWHILTSEPFHYFRDVSFADSQGKCEILEGQAKMYFNQDLTEDEKFAMQASKRAW